MMPTMLDYVRGGVVWMSLALLAAASAFAQSPITYQYFYDASGQLIQVVDSTGVSIRYIYDNAGNIVEIQRTTGVTAGTLAVFNFLPPQGGVGTTVTIQGQGFSTIPSENLVAFNGASATVVSASATALVVTVPANASTGPIAVTVGGQTATSTGNFIFVPAPAILSLSPRFVTSSPSVNNVNVTVNGSSLTGATFAFQPASVPPAVTVGSALIDPSGNSAVLSVVVAPGVSGQFTLVATNSSGSSSQIPSSANTLHVLDGNADDDGDGLTNAVEIAIGTDPLNPSTAGDGITDGWKVFYGLNPLDPSIATQDSDGDGLTNLQEFLAGTNPRIADRVPPAVSRIFPADQSSNYPLNGRVIVRFNEPLLAGVPLASAQAAINRAAPTLPAANIAPAALVLQNYLQNTCCGTSVVPGVVTVSKQGVGVAGSVRVSDDGLTVSFAPTQPLDPTTLYNVQVNGVRDAAGNFMTAAFLSSFTSGTVADVTAPTVQATSPQSGATNVPTNATFTVLFSKPMDASTLTPDLITLTDAQSGTVATGQVQVDPANTTASFIPNPPLLVGRTYFVNLAAGLQDTNGNGLAGGTFFSFTTAFDRDTDVPHLEATSPANGDSSIATNAVIMLEFNEPLSVVDVANQIQVSSGGQLVPGSIALSDSNRRVTFTPAVPLDATSFITVTVGAGITDLGGNLIDNPGSFSFQTGTDVDATQPTVVSISPANGAVNVPVNAAVQLQFNKPVSALTVNGLSLQVVPQDLSQGGGAPVRKARLLAAASPSGPPGSLAGTITVAADGLTATFVPSAPLAPGTAYFILTNGDLLDLEGNSFGFFLTGFTTGVASQTTGPMVTLVSPQNGDTNVPVNPRVVAQLNEAVAPATVGNNAIVVAAGGVSVPGAITTSADQAQVIFTPSIPLAASTNYSVSVSGFMDVAGNLVTPFSSSFTTGASSVPDTDAPQVVSVTPANAATGVPVTSNVVLTFNEAIDVTTVNANTVQVQVTGFTGSVAGSYSVQGPVVTFTPSSPLHGNSNITVVVSGVLDMAGVPPLTQPLFTSSFITAAGTDTVAPAVVAVTPSNGATNIGLNASVTITFSKSVNPFTLNGETLALFAGASQVGYSMTMSSDNRSVTLSPFFLPASSVVTVIATSGIQDFSGNALPDFRSQFTTSAGFDPTAAAVVAQRPGNGASGVPVTSPVVLFVSKPLDDVTVQDMVHVSQNGVLVQGTLTLKGNGQVIEFVPASPWKNNALIQIFFGPLTPGGGVLLAPTITPVPPPPANLASYQGSFTTAADNAGVPPTLAAASPSGAILAPLNAVIDLGFSEPLNPNTVNANTVALQNASTGQFLAGIVTLDATGTVIRFRPTLPFDPNTTYFVQTTTGIQGVNGVAQSFATSNSFTSGSAADNLPPVVTLVSPPDGSIAVPVNADIHVRFNEAIDPLTLTDATVQVSGGGQVAIAGTIRLIPTFVSGPPVATAAAVIGGGSGGFIQEAVITPQEPFPANTPMTITIAGVQDLAGNPVVAKTAHFTTGAGPATSDPQAVSTNPADQAFDVPLNTIISVQANVPVDPGTVNSNTFTVRDAQSGTVVSGKFSLSADQKSFSFLPDAPLAAGQTYFVTFAIGDGVIGVTDLAGNPLVCATVCNFQFTTAFLADNTPPAVVGVSPADQTTGVPINTQVVVQFNNPIDELNLDQVTLNSANGPVAAVPVLTNSQTTLILTPLVPLTESTLYTVMVAGVQDLAGNPLPAPVTAAFTTGNVADLAAPFVASISPANNSSAVPLNAVIQVQFTKRMDALTITPATFQVAPFIASLGNLQTVFILGSPLPGSVAVAPDGRSATFTPSVPLATEGSYQIQISNGTTDLPGQSLVASSAVFTTGVTTQATGPQVISISPPSGAADVPVNTAVSVLINGPVGPASVKADSIAVTAAGITVPGQIGISSDLTTISFFPSAPLATSTAYAVNVSGFTDAAGNPVTPFSSSFTTSASSVPDNTPPLAIAVSPGSGSFDVPVTTSVVVTFDEPVDPTSVNATTFAVVPSGFSGSVAGSYQVNGAVATFVPLLPLPGNVNIQVSVSGVRDFVGNMSSGFISTFATTAIADTTAPTVLSVTPANGATGIGLSPVVVLTFSKSLNAATVNSHTIGLLSGAGQPFAATVSISADNRIVTLAPNNLPAAKLITVVATSLVQDLSGNALADFTSQFTTSTGFDFSHASVVSQRPGNGAGAVPLDNAIALFIDEPLDPGTAPGALHVVQNGVVVNGTVQVIDNNQTILFQPALSWQNSALVQVFLDSTALDADGVPLNSYQSSFQTAANANTLAPALVAANPVNGGTGVPLNALVELGYNVPLNPVTVNSNTVFLFNQFGAAVAGTISLDVSGEIVIFTPTAPLAANTFYFVEATSGIQGANGLNAGFVFTSFTTGTAADNTGPTVTALSPASGASNVPVNGLIHLGFSEAINPLTVSSASITIADANQVAIPASISFSDNRSVLLTPQSPLAAGTLFTVTIAGVQDSAGNNVTPLTASFTTGSSPATAAPQLLSINPNGFGLASVNTAITAVINVPVDPLTVSQNTLQLFGPAGLVSGSYSVSPDGRTINFVPQTALVPGATYFVSFSCGGITDVAGNFLGCSSFTFITTTTPDTTGPSVTGTSPGNGQTNVPINAPVVVHFDEPVDLLTLGQITLTAGGAPVGFTLTNLNMNQSVTLSPTVLLAPLTSYTVSVTGVQDLSGNLQTATASATFTTGSEPDLSPPPSVAVVTPANGELGVPVNTLVQLQLSKPVDVLTLNASTIQLISQANNAQVPATMSVSPDGTTVSLTPQSPLAPSTSYVVRATPGINDVIGQSLVAFASSFVTVAGTPTLNVVSVNPPDTSTGIPVNVRVSVLLSESVDPASLGPNSIQVSAGGAAVPGVISANTNGTRVSFVPSGPLAPNTAYTVSVSGFTDLTGNAVVPFSSSFTTGTVADTSAPTVVSVSPLNLASNVPANTSIVLTFSKPVDPASVNSITIPISAAGFPVINGNYTVTGAIVTFTPSPALPGNTRIQVQVAGVQDGVGNVNVTFTSSFSTAFAQVSEARPDTDSVAGDGSATGGNQSIFRKTVVPGDTPAATPDDGLASPTLTTEGPPLLLKLIAARPL